MSESENGEAEHVPEGVGDQRLAAILAKEILSAKAVLPDLPSKKNGANYESWRDTVTEDLKTSIYAITKDTQGGKELLKQLCELIQSGNPDTTFPEISNLGLLLANLHVAIRKCAHKMDDSEPPFHFLDRYATTSQTSAITNASLLFLVSDSFFFFL